MSWLHSVAVQQATDHNHPANTFAARRGVLLKRINQQITTDPTVPVRRIYDAAAAQYSGDSDDIAAFENVRSRAKRFRSKLLPPIPAAIDDVHIVDSWSTTWRGTPFLSHHDTYWGVTVFTTTELLKTMQKCTCLFIDGTFRTAPRPYMQLVTVHGLHNGFVIPLVFCLATGKTIGHYRQIIQHLKNEVRRRSHARLHPRRVVCDFEQSLLIAIQTELPTTRVSGCFFHFTQRLWRRLQELGLAAHYRRDRRLKRFVRKVMAIAFLPVLLVRQNCRMIRISRLVGSLCRQFPRLGSVEEAKRKQSLGTRNILYQARGQPGFVKIIQNKIT